MSIKFLTGNAGKFKEAQAFFAHLEQVKIDLPEIQELDPHAVIKAKLESALATGLSEIIVEDTSLTFDGMNGLPGPLIKWFLHSLGAAGLHTLAQSFHIRRAEAKTVLGFARTQSEILFIEGITEGTIVAPRGDAGFGWDSIFLPLGADKTYAEMDLEEKLAVSHRTKALRKLEAVLFARS